MGDISASETSVVEDEMLLVLGDSTEAGEVGEIGENEEVEKLANTGEDGLEMITSSSSDSAKGGNTRLRGTPSPSFLVRRRIFSRRRAASVGMLNVGA